MRVTIYHGGNDEWKEYVRNVVHDCGGTVHNMDDENVYATVPATQLGRLKAYSTKKGLQFSIDM